MSDPGPSKQWGFMKRPNNVPYYQRLFQRNDGLRQWQKTPISKLILPPFYVGLFGGFAGCMYMMGRMVLGHKTWFGEG